MTTSTEERIEALQVALNNEKNEGEFYRRHSERTKDPLGKKMFKALADDEAEHYQRILELHKKLQSEGKWPDTLPLKVKDTVVKDILNAVIEGVDTTVHADTDDMEAVKIAIDFEAKGEAFYKKLRETVEDPQEKSFYHMLETMEREHRLSLEETLEYFKDPESWFQKMEKHHLDGA